MSQQGRWHLMLTSVGLWLMTLNHQQQQEVERQRKKRSSRYRQLMKRDTQTTRALTLQGQFSFVASTCLFSWHKFYYFSVQLTAPCKLSFTIYSIKRRPRFKAQLNQFEEGSLYSGLSRTVQLSIFPHTWSFLFLKSKTLELKTRFSSFDVYKWFAKISCCRENAACE